MHSRFDLAIVGSGFAGSLLAMIARRLGRSVALIERGRHPRFVIGESSTPLASLLLEELAARYDLPRLAPLTKWGAWQRTYPRIACGLKRGFTFYHHEFGAPFVPRADHAGELLVAASPRDDIADTHWFRPEFDQFFVEEAQALGVDYLDETHLEGVTFDGGEARLAGKRAGRPFELNARCVLDASGPRGFLHQALGLGELTSDHLPPTQALYSHFTGVGSFAAVRGTGLGEMQVPPYPPDDAALHHIFEGGWIWVLRFNNGLTSAGVAARDELAEEFCFHAGEPAWQRLLERLPSVHAQFAEARAARPFTHLPRLPFRSTRIVGPGWALLPSAAGFVDPLLSTGFPLTLLGVTRLAEVIEKHWAGPDFAARLADYARQTEEELLATARLVSALYATMNDFPTFAALARLYFAAASFSESARRLGQPQLARGFLLHEHHGFGEELRACCDFALQRRVSGKLSQLDAAELRSRIDRAIAPFDVAGLTDSARRGWFPACAEDLLAAAPKLRISRDEIMAMLARCGFTA